MGLLFVAIPMMIVVRLVYGKATGWVQTWAAKLLSLEKGLSQLSHAKGFSSVWVRTWRIK